MIKSVSLDTAASYSELRIKSAEVDLESFISIDNILPNKQGITLASNLPPQDCMMPAYKAGNILVGNIRPYLKKIWFANKNGGCSADVLVFEAKKGYSPQYLYYALFRDDFFKHMMRGKKGTKMPRGDKRQIMDFLVPDYPQIKQERIAKVLSTLDAKIENCKRISNKLEALAKTLYRYWFVQFDFPDEKGKPYKTSGGEMVHNSDVKRNIPFGWEAKTLATVLETSLGGTPSTRNKEFWDNGTFHWLNSGEVADFPVVTSELKITNTAIKSSNTELLPKRTVLLSITRHLRPTILAIDACVNQSVVGIKESGLIKCSYIYPYLQCEIPRYLVIRTGNQQPHINKETIDNSMLVIPPDNILKKYNQITEPLYTAILSNALQSLELTKLRDWLLPLLMNGQVTVK